MERAHTSRHIHLLFQRETCALFGRRPSQMEGRDEAADQADRLKTVLKHMASLWSEADPLLTLVNLM